MYRDVDKSWQLEKIISFSWKNFQLMNFEGWYTTVKIDNTLKYCDEQNTQLKHYEIKIFGLFFFVIRFV